MCESNDHTWLKPASSAATARSTIPRAGGSSWKTTPKSILYALSQVTREPARLVAAVTAPAVEGAAGHEHGAPGDDGVYPARHLEALVRRVVHVHVVGGRADAGATGRVVEHDVGVRTGGDDALARVEPEH